MEHSFDVEIAKKYGINAAVLLKNIYFWIEKNRANGKHCYDGYYWTYNSKKAFAELFPYMNERQIDYALKKLINDGIIITGNYNENKYDRTNWYAITKMGYSILQNCEMDLTILSNRNDNIVEPIPDINTDINTDINDKVSKKVNKDIEEETKEKKEYNRQSYEDIMREFGVDDRVRPTLWEFIQHCQLNGHILTNSKLEDIIIKLDFLDGYEMQNEALKTAINKGYFDIKTG